MTDMKQLTMGRRIQALRKQQGMTQETMAERLSVSPQAVSKWENDQSCPDIMTLPRIARLLDTTTDLLLTGSDAAATSSPAKKPEELVVRMAIEDEDGTRVCINLPFTVFRHAANYGMLNITYTANDGDEVSLGSSAALHNMDFKTIAQMIESGVTGKLLDLNDEGERLLVWTE